MKRMKKISLVLAGALCLSAFATGCGKSSNPAEQMKSRYSQYVTLGTYKGVEYVPNHTEVTDETIQKDIDSLISANKTTETKTEGTAALGDSVNIDYVGSIDGVEFEGGSTGGSGTTITLGSSGYIDDFDDQIVGHKVGETFNVNVTFPEDYGKEDLNGKDAVFVTTLNSIQVTTTPEYTDEFVAANSEYKTMAEFESAKRKEHEETNKTSDASQDRENLLKAVMDQTTISQVPEQEVEKAVDDTMSQIQQSAESNNIDVSTYIMYCYGFSSEEAFKANVKETVLTYVKEKMVVAAVATAEKIKVTESDAKAKKQQIMDSYGITDAAQLDGYYTEEDYYYYALAEKVMDFIVENAVAKEATSTDASTEATTEATTTAQ